MSPDANSPAIVLTWPDANKVVTVLHPAGTNHPNAIATRARLLGRGYQLRPLPADPELLLRAQPRPVAETVRALLTQEGQA